MPGLWQAALACWSPYLRLPPPRWCESPAELAPLGDSLAQFGLRSREVRLNGPALRRRGLLPQLPAILAHEIGHYACCPGDGEVHARLGARAFAGLGEARGQTALVLNLYEDLLINTRLQLEKGVNLVPLLRRMQPDSDFARWVLRLCEIRWRLPAGQLCPQPLTEVAEADALLAAELIAPRGRRLEANLHAFAGLCRPYLPATAVKPDWFDLAEAGAAGGLGALAAAPGTEPGASGRRQYLEPPAYFELRAQLGLSPDTALASYYRERAWPWLLAEPRPLPRQAEAALPEGTRPWELDRPIGDIDWPATLIQSPVVLPGMTTLRRHLAHDSGEKLPLRPQRLDLYLDASGSLPHPAASCSPLVLAATILALSALRLGQAVRVTVYSGPEQVVSTDFVRRDAPLLAALTTYFGGSTSFPLPLLQARSADAAGTALLLLSDEGYRAAWLPQGPEPLLALGRAYATVGWVLQLLRPAEMPSDLLPLQRAGWRMLGAEPEGLARRALT